MTRDSATCVAWTCQCANPFRHEPDCTRDSCKKTADGTLLTCYWHRDQLVDAAKALPDHHAALAGQLAPYRSPQAPKGEGGRSSEAPGLLNAAVFEMRAGIFEWLEIFTYAAMRGQHLTSPGRGVPLMGRFVGWHADWLCSDPIQAPAAASRLPRLARDAAALRARHRSVGLYLGPCPVSPETSDSLCGGPVRYDRDQAKVDPTYQVECPWCKTRAVVSWWVDRMGGTVPTLMPAAQLAMYLGDTLALELAATGRHLTSSWIGKWKHEGRIQPVQKESRTGRDLFNRHDVEAFVRETWKLGPAA